MKTQEERKKIVEEIACKILYSSNEELAAMSTSSIIYDLNISRSYASILLKEDSQNSIYKLIQKEKMFRIRVKMSLDKTYTIEKACEDFGIGKAEHLIGKFKRMYVLTPGRFKKCHHGGKKVATFTM